MVEEHVFSVRVYYEDTDAAGVVYYANYMKFAERARTEMIRDAGIVQMELKASDGVMFVVRHCEMDLFKPAMMDDLLEVRSVVTECKGASFVVRQEVCRGDDVLALLVVKVACVNVDSMAACRIPDVVLCALK